MISLERFKSDFSLDKIKIQNFKVSKFKYSKKMCCSSLEVLYFGLFEFEVFNGETKLSFYTNKMCVSPLMRLLNSIYF